MYVITKRIRVPSTRFVLHAPVHTLAKTTEFNLVCLADYPFHIRVIDSYPNSKASKILLVNENVLQSQTAIEAGIFMVTHYVAPKVLLTSKQRLRLSICSLY